MEYIDGNTFKMQEHIANMVDIAKAKKTEKIPEVRRRTDKAFDLLDKVKRKGALNNEREYHRIREAFEQNYTKLN